MSPTLEKPMETQAAPQATPQAQDRPAGASSSYKRASRKGAPRRFACNFPGCDKLYSRAEHLQRHQLNRAPTQLRPVPLLIVLLCSSADTCTCQTHPRRSTVATSPGYGVTSKIRQWQARGTDTSPDSASRSLSEPTCWLATGNGIRLPTFPGTASRVSAHSLASPPPPIPLRRPRPLLRRLLSTKPVLP